MNGHNGVTVAGEHPAYAIMGPAVCQGCGTKVWYARGLTRLDGKVVPGLTWWRERSGAVHGCQPIAAGHAARRVRAQLSHKVGRHPMLSNARAEWERRR